jgi:cell division protein FtsB
LSKSVALCGLSLSKSVTVPFDKLRAHNDKLRAHNDKLRAHNEKLRAHNDSGHPGCGRLP